MTRLAFIDATRDPAWRYTGFGLECLSLALTKKDYWRTRRLYKIAEWCRDEYWSPFGRVNIETYGGVRVDLHDGIDNAPLEHLDPQAAQRLLRAIFGGR